MTRTVLTLRINRRAIGAVVLGHESLELADGRHLTSKADKTALAAKRFVEYLFSVTKPALVVLDAPSSTGGTATARILAVVADVAVREGLELLHVSKADILSAYGITGIRTRRELRELVRHYWSELATIRGKVVPFIIDAAAAALYAECRLDLERIAA
jgi:hypothetical protein